MKASDLSTELSGERIKSFDGPPLRIALLAHGLRVAGGITVGKGLLAALARVAPQHAYYVTIPPGLGYEEICQAFPHCQVFTYQHRGNLLHRLRDERHLIAAKVRAFKPDLVWALGNVRISRPGCPQALILVNPHRVYPVLHVGPISRVERVIRLLRNSHLRRSLSDVDMVFCQTQTMRRRFIDQYGYRGRVEVCPTAGAVQNSAPGRVEPPAIFNRLQGKFVLFCLCNYYTHKNLEGLIDTFTRYRNELRDYVILLSILPEQSKKARIFLSRIEKEGVGENIINLGQRGHPHPELAGYYQHSQGMILPTLLESYSSTYIEAMQSSCPILTSDLDFAREVCGDAAVYFNPWEPRSIRDAILRLKNETGLADLLIERGKTLLAKFPRSWDEIARNAMDQLQRLQKDLE